jgi:hypothetical protein
MSADYHRAAEAEILESIRRIDKRVTQSLEAVRKIRRERELASRKEGAR